MGKSIGIIAIKGGVGKTSCTASLGAALAYQFGKKVLLVDANFSAPNLGLHFGLTDPKKTIHDVLSGSVPASSAIHCYNGNLHLIPASLVSNRINPHQLKQKLAQVKDDYDVIMLDSSPNLNEEMLSTMLASDELYVVTAPDYPTLSTTLRAVKLAKERGTKIKGLIINRIRGKSYELSLNDIEEAAGVPVIGALPEDDSLPEAVSKTTPLAYFNPKSSANYEFNKIAAAMINQPYKDNRIGYRLRKAFGKIGKEELNRDVMRFSGNSNI